MHEEDGEDLRLVHTWGVEILGPRFRCIQILRMTLLDELPQLILCTVLGKKMEYAGEVI